MIPAPRGGVFWRSFLVFAASGGECNPKQFKDLAPEMAKVELRHDVVGPLRKPAVEVRVARAEPAA